MVETTTKPLHIPFHYLFPIAFDYVVKRCLVKQRQVALMIRKYNKVDRSECFDSGCKREVCKSRYDQRNGISVCASRFAQLIVND